MRRRSEAKLPFQHTIERVCVPRLIVSAGKPRKIHRTNQDRELFKS